MDRKFLEGLGLEKETIDKIMKAHGKTLNDTKEKADKVDSLESQINDYKEQLNDRDNQLKELKKVDPEALQAEIERLEDENEEKATEFQEQLSAQAKDFAIESALRDAKARNPKIAKNALDVDAITFKDGKLIGMDEQLTSIKESDAYLFGEDEPAGLKGRNPHVTDGSGDLKNTITQEKFDKMGYSERVELYNKDLETYQRLNNK